MNELTNDEIRDATVKMRAMAGKTGPMDPYWAIIFDAEAMLVGRPTVMSRQQIIEEILAFLGRR